MRLRTAAAAAVLTMMSVSLLSAGAPDLEPSVHIYNGSSPISVAYMSSPAVVDWNNDGLKDLLVSEFSYGKIWLFINQGTDINPVFNGGTYIKSGGIDITTSYG